MLPGQRLCPRSTYECTRDLRSDLQQLNVDRAKSYTLKSFKAGKATDMAQRGESLAAILQAGEWRSSALLRYISESELDKKAFLDAMDAEEEDE